MRSSCRLSGTCPVLVDKTAYASEQGHYCLRNPSLERTSQTRNRPLSPSAYAECLHIPHHAAKDAAQHYILTYEIEVKLKYNNNKNIKQVELKKLLLTYILFSEVHMATAKHKTEKVTSRY